MPDSTPERVELARRILAHETSRSPDAVASAAALETACRRLKDHLTDFLGAGGVSALLTRALHLAQREQPILAGVTVRGDPAGCFTGVAESLAGSTDEEATAATTAVIAHVIDLLVMLLGEELGTKPIHKLWPHATVRENEE